MRHGRKFLMVACAVVLAALLPTPAIADGEEDGQPVERQASDRDRIDLSGDFVPPPISEGTTSRGGDDGYTLTSPYPNGGQYRVVLLTSTGVQQYRPITTAVVAELREVLGPYFVLDPNLGTAPSNPADFTADPGEIQIIVNGQSPCSGGWIGCGGPDSYTLINDKFTSMAGRVWLHPDLTGYSDAVKEDVIGHEIGHALGLGHYDALYRNKYQLMKSFVNAGITAPTGYRAGDRNGLLDSVGARPRIDARANARAISVPSPLQTANNWFATARSGDPELSSVYGKASNRSVWFKFQARAADVGRTFVIETINDGQEDFNTLIGRVTKDRLAAHDNDSGPGKLSRMTLTPTNTTSVHYFVVDGYNGARGVTQLRLRQA